MLITDVCKILLTSQEMTHLNTNHFWWFFCIWWVELLNERHSERVLITDECKILLTSQEMTHLNRNWTISNDFVCNLMSGGWMSATHQSACLRLISARIFITCKEPTHSNTIQTQTEKFLMILIAICGVAWVALRVLTHYQWAQTFPNMSEDELFKGTLNEFWRFVTRLFSFAA